MNFIIRKDKQTLSDMVASRIASRINEKPSMVLGLATGNSPLGVYQSLIDMYKSNIISFRDVITFNLDEYVDYPSYENSYAYYMSHHLFQHIDIRPQNCHFPTLDTHDYNLLLKKYPIDLQLLGIGSNGHIGFNEPHTSFGNETSLVRLADQTRTDNAAFFETLSCVPTEAITMGIKNIMKSKEIVLLAFGESKKEILFQMAYGPITEKVPASILQLHPNVYVYADDEAALRIKDIIDIR